MAETNFIKFRRGLESQIEKDDNLIYGSINFAVDNPGLFIDIYDKYETNGQPASDAKVVRKRVSDIIVCDTYEDLLAEGVNGADILNNYDYKDDEETGWAPSKRAIPSWNANALYYVLQENALLKYIPNSTNPSAPGSWKRVNADLDKIAKRFESLLGRENDPRNALSLYGIKNDLIGQSADVFDEHKSLYGLYNEIEGSYSAVTDDTTKPEYNENSFKEKTIGELQSVLVHLQNYTHHNFEQVTGSLLGSEDLPENVSSISGLYTYLTDNGFTDLPPEDQKDKITSFPEMISLVNAKMTLADAMTFKGVLDATKKLPTDASTVKAGDTYKVGQLGIFVNNEYTPVTTIGDDQKDIAVYIGDIIVADKDNELSFTHISSGYEEENEASFRYETDSEDIHKHILKLENPVGIELGRLSMVGSDDSNIKINGHSSPGRFGDTITYSLGLEWGTFE